MLTRSVTNTIIHEVEKIHLTCDISSPSSMRPIAIKSEALDTRAGPSCSHHSEHSFAKPLTPSCTSNAFTFELCTTVSQTPSHLPKSCSKKTSRKTPYLKAAAKPGLDREAKIRELKGRALKIKATGNAPASEHQRLLLLMVFDEITPYPDESWLAHISVVIRRYVPDYNAGSYYFIIQFMQRIQSSQELVFKPTTEGGQGESREYPEIYHGISNLFLQTGIRPTQVFLRGPCITPASQSHRVLQGGGLVRSVFRRGYHDTQL